MRRLIFGPLIALLALVACSKGGNPTVGEPPPGSAAPSTLPLTGQSIVVTSPAFAPNGTIPVRYTCRGQNISPPLQWTNIPPEAKELALVLFDPDAGSGGFLHWVAFKIPAATKSLSEGSLPAGVRQATGGTGKAQYAGPCPPAGKVHHYQFTLSALRSSIDLRSGAPGAEVRAQIASKKIVDGMLVGLHQRR